MPEPANLFLPWRDADGYNIVDCDGVRVASVPHEDARRYIIEAANAYHRLRAALDKALEACRWLEAANRLSLTTVTRWQCFDPRVLERCGLKERIAMAKARRLAREALEVAKERDRRG